MHISTTGLEGLEFQPIPDTVPTASFDFQETLWIPLSFHPDFSMSNAFKHPAPPKTAPERLPADRDTGRLLSHSASVMLAFLPLPTCTNNWNHLNESYQKIYPVGHLKLTHRTVHLSFENPIPAPLPFIPQGSNDWI